MPTVLLAGDAGFYEDSDKAAEVLGWKTEKTLEDMCRKIGIGKRIIPMDIETPDYNIIHSPSNKGALSQ